LDCRLPVSVASALIGKSAFPGTRRLEIHGGRSKKAAVKNLFGSAERLPYIPR
jgi:hypothetical protein